MAVNPGCPTGYKWDGALGRCVKLPTRRCPIGYQWNGTRCVRNPDYAGGPGSCPPGSHWVAGLHGQRGQCVPNAPGGGKCPPGQQWNSAAGQCEPISGHCPPGQEWSDPLGKCVPLGRCPPGQRWNADQQRCEEDPADRPCGPGTKWDATQNLCVPDPGNTTGNEDVRDLLYSFLTENGLCPDAACKEPLDFITTALAQDKSANQIIAELRETDFYKAAYPENALRQQQGFSFMPESQIRAYRDEAKRIANNAFGIDVSNQEVSNLIGNDVSLTEWESRLRTFEDFKRWGPTVRGVLEQELGTRIPDDRVFAFLDPSISTPDLDRAYENALYRGRPALLGLGVRPEDEATLLRRYGIDPEQAFRGYQGIVQEMPREERLAAIEAQIAQTPNLPSNGTALFNDTPFATLFRAIQLGDPDAIRKLQDQMAREVARFSGGGGAVMQGSQAVGLLTAGERAQG